MDVMSEFLLSPALYAAPMVAAGMMVLAALVWAKAVERRKSLVNQRVGLFGLANSKYQTVQGVESGYYFDAELFLGSPENIDLVLNWLEYEINAEQRDFGSVDRLVFVERRDGPIGGVTLKDLVSWKTWIPGVVVRPERKGPAARIKGAESELLSGMKTTGTPKGVKTLVSRDTPEHVVVVSDVATTGTNLTKAVQLVRGAGAKVNTALVLFDRDQGARETLASIDVRLIALDSAKEQPKLQAA